jgi:hypothetical protein
MDAMKDGLAVLAGIIGLATTALTLYAKYLDVKKSAAVEKEATAAAPTARLVHEFVVDHAEPAYPYASYRPPIACNLSPSLPDASTIQRVRGWLKGPAITMIVLGSLSLFGNMGLALFGFVNEFVTPITDESKIKQANLAAIERRELIAPPGMTGSMEDQSEKMNTVATMFLLMGLSLPSAVGIWGGINMLRLKGYWVSVAGSFAIMAGASLACCMTGAPVGGWSLWVLFKPEVASSFK